MATVTKYGNTVHRSGGNDWRTYMTITIEETATQVKAVVTMGMHTVGGEWIKAGTRSATLKATDGTTYTYTKKDSKEEGDKKYAYISSKTYTWNKSTSAQTKTITAKIVYEHSEQDGTSTATYSVSVPALQTYTYTYNRNGGGTTTTATHYYGKATTLPAAPTKTGYKFVGWKTGTTTYVAGASVNINAATTFTAQWQATYTAPKITNLRAYRVASRGSSYGPTVAPTGTVGYCDFALSTGTGITISSVTIKFGTGTAVTASTSGSNRFAYSASGQSLSAQSQYTVTVTVTLSTPDGTKTLTASTFIAAEIVAINVTPTGKGLGLLARAKGDGSVAVGGDVYVGCNSDGTGGTKVVKEGHNHDDRYYTETEINTKLDGKSNTTHTHGWTSYSSNITTYNPSLISLSTKIGSRNSAIGISHLRINGTYTPSSDVSAGASRKVCNVPTAMRPSGDMAVVVGREGGSTALSGYMDSNGDVYLINHSSIGKGNAVVFKIYACYYN